MKLASSEQGAQEGTTKPDIDKFSVESEPARTSSDSDPPTRPQRRASRFTTLWSELTDPPRSTQPTAVSMDDSDHPISEASSAAMEMDSDENQAANSPKLSMNTKKRPSSMLDEYDDMRPSIERTRSKRIAILSTPDAMIETPPARNTRSSNRTGSAVQRKKMTLIARSRMQAIPEAFTVLSEEGDETLQGTTASGILARKKDITCDGDAALETSPRASRTSKATPPPYDNADKQATKGLQNTNMEAGPSAPGRKSLSNSHQETNPVCPVRARCHIAGPHYFHCTEAGCNRTGVHRPSHLTIRKKAQAKSPQPIFISSSSPRQLRSSTSSPIGSPPPSSPGPPQTAEIVGAASRRLMNASRFLAQTSKSLGTPFDFDTIEPREARQGMRRLRRTLRLWGTVERQVRTALKEVIAEMEMLGKGKGQEA